ncbi:MAG: ornithine carbamoyltransferase [Dehalococcoidia bacterium]
MKRDFLYFADLPPADVLPLLERAIALKKGERSSALSGKSVVLMFEKPSLRTKLSFWVGTEKLGGRPVYFGPEEVGLGKREPVADVAKVISRMVDIAVIRTFAQSTLDQFAAAASIPVVNALSDAEHPCQALADLMTILEHRGSLKGATVAYIGDGNNIAVSLAQAVAATGGRFVIASPEGYELPVNIARRARSLGAEMGGEVELITHPREAVADADIVYTDVWTSMGQEAETQARLEAFKGYQVNPRLLDAAGPQVKFMHDLPAHPGEEVSTGLLDDPRSIVFDQAENRLWAQAALLETLANV